MTTATATTATATALRPQCPKLIAGPDAGPARGLGYRRRYRIEAAPGACLVQRVRTHIRYLVGSVPWAEFRQTYHEFFAFDADAPADAHVVDLHDFDLVRDGWRQAVILGLVRRHLAPGASGPTGEAELHLCKQFVLAPGEVRDAAPRRFGPGVTFGVCADGPSGPSGATLRLRRGDGTWTDAQPMAPGPAGFAVAGRASFATSPRLGAFECFRYHFASLAGRLADRGTYLPHRTQP